MSDHRIRRLERQIAADPGNVEALAALGQELRRSIDVIGLITGMSESIQAAIAVSCVESATMEQAIEALTDGIDAQDVAAHFTTEELIDALGIDASDVAEEFDADDIAEELDVSEIAREISLDDLAPHIDIDDLAGHFDASDIAGEIDVADIAGQIDLAALAQAVKDLM